MESRPECPPSEDIIRAITESLWDDKNKRASSSAFRGPYTSVSRIAILSLKEIFAIFFRDLEERIICSCEINIGTLQDLGENHSSPILITVVEDPIVIEGKENPAHAEIPQQLPRGFCRKLAKNYLLIHHP